MTEKQLDYFAGDHTAKGFYELYSSNFQQLDHGFSLKSKLESSKSDFMKDMADKWRESGFDIEIIHSSSFKNGIDSVINRELKVALYDGDLYRFDFNGNVKEYDLDEEINRYVWQIKQERKQPFDELIGESFYNAQDSFKKGLYVHDGLEEIYINNMDFQKTNQLASEITDEWLSNVNTVEKDSKTIHRFFGAVTPTGIVDYIPQLTKDCQKRYFIKGRAGTGKSTLLRKVAAEVRGKGFDIELYHCGFDPDSIDMVLVRELGLCAFDSTDPHEYFPEREGDVTIDIYEKAVEPNTDEKYATAIEILTDSYKSYMKKGAMYIKQANEFNDEWEQQFLNGVDTQKQKELIDKIYKQTLNF